MLKDNLNKYRPSIDPDLSEDGQELGINLISNVENPAVQIKGVAFSNHSIKDLEFKDDKKLRIAAPVLVPDEIYRDDSDEKYYMVFTKSDVEMLAKDFMSRLPTRGKEVFNLEHGEQMVDSYLLETILADSQTKVDMIKEDYGVEVPLGTFFIVQQFNDEKVYNDIVDKKATSFSFEGFLGTELINEFKFTKEELVNKHKNKKEKMKNLKLGKMESPKKTIGYKRVLLSASKKKMREVVEKEDLILVADELKEGNDVVVIEDITEGSKEDFTGEVDVEDKVIIIEKGVVSEVVESEEKEVEAEEDKEKEVKAEEDETKETKMEDDKDSKEVEAEKDDKDSKEVKAEDEDEETKEVKAEEDEDKSKEVEAEEEVNSELEELYKMIADLKAEISDIKSGNVEESEYEEDKDVNEHKFTDALIGFNEINN